MVDDPENFMMNVQISAMERVSGGITYIFDESHYKKYKWKDSQTKTGKKVLDINQVTYLNITVITNKTVAFQLMKKRFELSDPYYATLWIGIYLNGLLAWNYAYTQKNNPQLKTDF